MYDRQESTSLSAILSVREWARKFKSTKYGCRAQWTLQILFITFANVLFILDGDVDDEEDDEDVLPDDYADDEEAEGAEEEEEDEEDEEDGGEEE